MRLVFVLVIGVGAAGAYAVFAPDAAPALPAPARANIAAVGDAPALGELPPAHPPIDSSRASAGRVLDGIVAEVLDVPRYTYLRLTLPDHGEAWAAVATAKLDVGARVRVREEVEMRDFASPTLKRTFPQISFGAIEAP